MWQTRGRKWKRENEASDSVREGAESIGKIEYLLIFPGLLFSEIMQRSKRSQGLCMIKYLSEVSHF